MAISSSRAPQSAKMTVSSCMFPPFLLAWVTKLIIALRWPHSRPRPYPCTITPRSPDIESAIAHAMEMHSIVA